MIYIGIENDGITITIPLPNDSGKCIVCEMTPEAALEVIEKIKIKIAELERRDNG